MNAVMFVSGAVIVAVTLYDALSTTTSLTSPGGPITSRLAWWVWRALHGRNRGRWRMQDGAGPIVLISIIVAWVVLLWLGWTLVFAADSEAIVPASGTIIDGFWGHAYYAGFTVSTLGVGDFRATSDFWRMLTIVSAISGLTLITMAVTFVLPVVTAVTQRRQQAATIALYGAAVSELAHTAYDGQRFSRLDAQLTTLAQGILLVAERHLAYPILHYFHERDRHVSLSVNLAALDVTFAILSRTGPDREPSPVAVKAIRGATTRLLDIMEHHFLRGQSSGEPGVSPALVAAIAPGVDVEELTTAERDRWRLLALYVEQDGWEWSDVVGKSVQSMR